MLNGSDPEVKHWLDRALADVLRSHERDGADGDSADGGSSRGSQGSQGSQGSCNGDDDVACGGNGSGADGGNGGGGSADDGGADDGGADGGGADGGGADDGSANSGGADGDSNDGVVINGGGDINDGGDINGGGPDDGGGRTYHIDPFGREPSFTSFLPATEAKDAIASIIDAKMRAQRESDADDLLMMCPDHTIYTVAVLLAYWYQLRGELKESYPWLTRRFNHLQWWVTPLCYLYLLMAVLMQAALPLAMVAYWAADEDVSWAGFFKHSLFRQPAGGSADMPSMGVWVRLAKGLVGTYVMFVCWAQDLSQAFGILLQFDAFDRRGHPLLMAFKWAVACTQMACVTWLLLITWALLVRVQTVVDVILSGVGTLFILDIDDCVTVLQGAIFEPMVKALIQRNQKLQDQEEEQRAQEFMMNLPVYESFPPRVPPWWRVALDFVLVKAFGLSEYIVRSSPQMTVGQVMYKLVLLAWHVGWGFFLYKIVNPPAAPLV